MSRMWHWLGVQVYICPPHRPDRNGCVERYNKSYKYECLLIERPADVGQVREVTAVYHHHDNYERPNQAKPCGNQPPRVTFPSLPKRPSLPTFLDPDGWVQAIDGERYARKVRGDGCVSLGERSYYVQQALAGKRIILEVDGRASELVVWSQQEATRRIPIKGLQQTLLPWEAYVAQLHEEARTEWRRSSRPGRRGSQPGNGYNVGTPAVMRLGSRTVCFK